MLSSKFGKVLLSRISTIDLTRRRRRESSGTSAKRESYGVMTEKLVSRMQGPLMQTPDSQLTLTPWDSSPTLSNCQVAVLPCTREHEIKFGTASNRMSLPDDETRAQMAADVCAFCGDGGELLLCDGQRGHCNAAYHVACVGLKAVPSGEWFCPKCCGGEDSE